MRTESGDGEAGGSPEAVTSPTPADSAQVGVDGRPGPVPTPAAQQQQQPQQQHQNGPPGVGRPPPMMLRGVSPRPATGGERGRGRGRGGLGPPHTAIMSPMMSPAAHGWGAGGEFRPNKRMPRDPATNARICFEFVRGACPRPSGTCRYAHVVPPPHVYQSLQMMGAFGAGAGPGPGGGAGGLPAPSPLLQHHLQQLSRCVTSVASDRSGRVGDRGGLGIGATGCPCYVAAGSHCVPVEPPQALEGGVHVLRRSRRLPARAFASFANLLLAEKRNN